MMNKLKNIILLSVVLALMLGTQCGIVHPPLSIEQESANNQTRLIKNELQQNIKTARSALPNSVGVIPFIETGTDYGLGLAATEFFTANLSLFNSFNLVDMSYSSILNQEFAAFSPQKKRQALKAEQLVTGILQLQNGRLTMAGVRMRQGDRSYKKIAIRKGNGSEFFRLVADLNIYFLQQNGITITRRMAQRLYQIPTENIKAYILYAKGRHQEYLGNFQAAMNAYRRAHKLDPRFQKAEQSSRNLKARIASMPPHLLRQKLGRMNQKADRHSPNIEEKYVPPVTESGTVIINFSPSDETGQVLIDFPLPEGP